MSYLGYEALKLEKFGGLNTLLNPTNLPAYASPDCSDVEFLPGLVRTRPGTTSLFTALGGNPTVNYLKSYITPTVLLRALALDSLGNFYKENPAGTLALIGQIENSGVYGNSVSLFGREYIAFGDGKFGVAIPRQFDDTNFDRASQAGPAVAPSAADESISFTIAAGPTGAVMDAALTIAASPAGITESGNVVTVNITNVGGITPALQVGDPILVAGVPVGGYNGTFTISAITGTSQLQYINPTTGLAGSGGGGSTVAMQIASITTTVNNTFVKNQLVLISGVGVAGYNGTWAVRNIAAPNLFEVAIASFNLAGSGGGTAASAGNIVAGVHRVSVVFVTRQGYITEPAPFATWTAGGGKRVILSNILLGPSNVTQRIIIFTAAGGKSFFYSIGDPSIFTSSMVIADNTTKTVTIDFSDAILLAGVNVDQLFELVELGECAGVTQYFSRLFWWGERNKVDNFNNLSFDGGDDSSFTLKGWTFAAGRAPFLTYSPGQFVWGGAYAYTGDNVTASSAIISQTAYQDASGAPILFVNTAYSVRLRARCSPHGGTVGNVNVEVFSATAGSLGIATVTYAQLSTTFQEFILPLIAAQATIPSDVVLRVYVNGTPNAADRFNIDNIEIFPTNTPNNTTIVRASKVEEPESYDGVTGFLDVAPSNGQAVRCAYVRRNNLYFVKERSLYVTQADDNEPNQWTIQEVSQKVGTLSVRGVGFGDEWEIIAGLDGVYYFDGSEPQKISQEIQPTWDSINWSLGHLVDVKVDTKRKRVYIAVPLGASATANNRILTLDYTDGFGDPNPTNTVNIAGVGRKWAPWLIACNSMNFILRSDGTQQLWFGNGTGLAAATGKIYQLDATGAVFSDDGAAINSYWQSGYFQDAGRLLFGPLVANVVGSGALSLILRKGDQAWLTSLRSWTLPAIGFRNMERMLNIETERLALRFGTNAVGANFSLQGVQLYAREAVWAALRGVNY